MVVEHARSTGKEAYGSGGHRDKNTGHHEKNSRGVHTNRHLSLTSLQSYSTGTSPACAPSQHDRGIVTEGASIQIEVQTTTTTVRLSPDTARVVRCGLISSRGSVQSLPWNNTATTAGGLATSEFPGRHGRTVVQWAEGSLSAPLRLTLSTEMDLVPETPQKPVPCILLRFSRNSSTASRSKP